MYWINKQNVVLLFFSLSHVCIVKSYKFFVVSGHLFLLLLSRILSHSHRGYQVYNYVILSANNKNVASSFRCTPCTFYSVILIPLSSTSKTILHDIGDNRDPWPAIDFNRNISLLGFYHKTWYYDTDSGIVVLLCSLKHGSKPIIRRFGCLFVSFFVKKTGLDIISKTHLTFIQISKWWLIYESDELC